MRYLYDNSIIELLDHYQGLASKRIEPVYKNDEAAVQIFQEDAVIALRSLPAESIDFIFADPPYFLSGGGISCRNRRKVSVNKGDWDVPIGLEAEQLFTERWLTACKRLLKHGGTICVSATMHNLPVVAYALRKLDYWILNDIIWRKPDPPPNLSKMYFTHSTETIMWARKSRKSRHTFNYDDACKINGGSPILSVLTIAPPKACEKQHGRHPTQKPEELLDVLIRICTNPGNHVLDPFAGSGTTGAVCVRNGRGYTGIERVADFNRIAIARVEKEAVKVQFPDFTYKLK